MARTDWTAAEAVARRVLAGHGGLARLGAFLAAGLTAHQVAALHRRGVLARPRNAWYCDPTLPWEAQHAIRIGRLATCASAAHALGLPVPPDTHRVVHVSVEPNDCHFRHRRDKTWHVAAGDDDGARIHWVRRVAPALGWRTSLLDTLIQLSQCVPGPWFVAAVDAALHEPRDRAAMMTSADFVQLLMHLPRSVRRTLRRVDPRSESCLETLLRLGLIRRGIGPFDLQVWTHPEHRVDILVGRGLILEADGEAYHDPERDAIRDALMRELGYRVLRFTYDQIVFHLEAVLDEIEAALLETE